LDGDRQLNAAPLIDPFQRQITYLRVSVTDRCDFRCVYCMAEDMTFLVCARPSCGSACASCA
jgi:GTP 3',8-cyclase